MSGKINLVGHKYNLLTVIEEDPIRISKKIRWRCVCDCGNICTVIGNDLRTNKTKSCGCLNIKTIESKKIDLSNKKMGRLTVVSETYSKRSGRWWLCKCDCGKDCVVKGCAIVSGNTKSCGCLAQEIKKSKVGPKHHNWKHSLSKEDRADRRLSDKVTMWRNEVFSRDEYKCKVCNSGGELNAHHLDGWNWCIEKRHDIDNSVTLCVPCHKLFHKIYGSGDNVSEEFFEFYIVRMKND